MPRFAANLSTLYREHDFLARFGAAAADGFAAVECQFPYDHAAAELAHRLADNGLQQVLFNAPPGPPESGARGLACRPGSEAAFRSGVLRALEYAQALQCPRIHVMAGLVPAAADAQRVEQTWLANLAWAAQQAAGAGCEVLIEPLNTRDNPGYFLTRQDQAHHTVRAIGAANLKVQMDLYHCQIAEGDLAMKLRRWLPTGQVGHLQIAGVPLRQEPDLGELHYPYLFDLIDDLAAQHDWHGWIGCEYHPARGAAPGATSAGLDWLRARGNH